MTQINPSRSSRELPVWIFPAILVITLSSLNNPLWAQARVDSGSACGAYSVYVLTQFFKKPVDIRTLVSPRYVTGAAGSTLQDLQRAVSDSGLSGIPLSNMTPQTLAASPYPMILHVRKAPDSKIYDHWIAFLGTADGKLTVYDPPNPLEHVSYTSLSLLWDGNGLVVSNRSIDLNRLAMAGATPFAAWAMAIIALVFVVKLWPRKPLQIPSLPQWSLKSLAEGSAIIIVAACVGMSYNIYAGDGVLATDSSNVLAKAYDTTFMPRISTDQLSHLIQSNPRLVLIDARLADDYLAGHIANAISIPVDSSDAFATDKMKHISPEATAVIYCQSLNCEFAELIATRLHMIGLQNIILYPGGWMAWSKEYSH